MESGTSNILFDLFDLTIEDENYPKWVDNAWRDDEHDVSDSFEASTYERIGIVVQAYKDYYETYLLDDKRNAVDSTKLIPYVGDAINYSYQKGDYEKGISRIYDGGANIHGNV